MSDHVYDWICPKCKKRSWVNNGDTDDLTVPDVEWVECPHCGHVDRPCENWEDIDGNNEYGGRGAEKAHKSPNEAYRV